MSLDLPFAPMLAERGGEYRTVDLKGEAHYIDFGGEGTPVVFVHGLGGAALNFMQVAPLLREAGHHVYAIDLAGFGLTRAQQLSSSVRGNAGLVSRFIDQVAGEPVVLVGNSMGGLITAMVASMRPELVQAVVLLGPAMPVPKRYPGRQLASLRTLATPIASGVVGRVRKRPLTPEAEVEVAMRVCLAERDSLDPDVFEAHVDLAKIRRGYPEVTAAMGLATRTMFREIISHGQVVKRYRSIEAPVLLINGAQDRLVDVEAARWAKRANPRWSYEEWDDTGHVPMLEHPERTASTIAQWVGTHVRSAA
ncbi:alpha/beta fold hydrolase [Calidifontibacter indicus]|uniref:alpha/beta fold hydrolase n=1 Tax=Calidifontibacter indicus TaxID=419650 RepID=UPI003D746083